MSTVPAGLPAVSPAGLPLPNVSSAQVLVAAPGSGPGHWAGAPSAVAHTDTAFWLAYRVRRPVDQGRGIGVVLARLDDTGLHTVGQVTREAFDAASLERPALVRRPNGGWRLYVSCSTPGSKHWWIAALDADDIAGLPSAQPMTAFPGDDTVGVKDPVVLADASGWHAWICCHPLDEPGEEDRMWTAYARSDDGLVWTTPVAVLRPPGPGRWDSRGTRLTSVLPGPNGLTAAFYDGRRDAAANWYERTGVAVPGPSSDAVPARDPYGTPLVPTTAPPLTSPHGTHALRYLCVVPLPSGGFRLFFEASRADGAHDLLTQTVGGASQVESQVVSLG